MSAIPSGFGPLYKLIFLIWLFNLKQSRENFILIPERCELIFYCQQAINGISLQLFESHNIIMYFRIHIHRALIYK